MKIRMGFVSNSSSSSFLCACKGDLKTEINNLFGSFPIKSFSEDFFNIVKTSKKIKNLKELNAYMKDNYLEEDSDIIMHATKYINDGYTVYLGSFSDEEDGLENYLCCSGVDIDTETFKLKSDEGY